MSDILQVRPADLLIDEQNPRLSEPNAGQREAHRAMAHHQQRKLYRLAKHIVEHGLDPSQLPIVSPSENDVNRYIVLEGNRRLAALKALENPDSLVDAIAPGILKEIRKLSKQYQQAPIDFVQCVVVKDRAEANTWIELKHTGENEGASMVKWDSVEAGRFRARSGSLPPHLQALAFLEKRGDLTLEKRQGVAATSLKRLLESPVVREKIGLELRNKVLFLRAEADKVAKALMHVVENLPRVGKIYTKEDRIEFANKLPSRIVVVPTVAAGQGIALSDAEDKFATTQTKSSVVRLPRQRERLIPSNCALNVTDPRVRAIEGELRHLNTKFANAVGVLFRVFIELSADCYIIRLGLATTPDAHLTKKLQDVAHDLMARQKLTSQQAKPVNRAASSDSFLAPSVKLMNDYVHNQHTFPAPGDLLASWNSLQPFITAVWAL
jgi:hypothetical protein